MKGRRVERGLMNRDCKRGRSLYRAITDAHVVERCRNANMKLITLVSTQTYRK